MNSKHSYHAPSTRGFTLIELMIVIAILGVIATLAFPGYTSYLQKARRADAHAALARVQAEQGRFRANNATYGSSLAGLNIPNSTSEAGYYTIAITGASAAGYAVQAVANPATAQGRDSACSTMTISWTAASTTYTPAACWTK